MRLPDHLQRGYNEALHDLALRGLAKRTWLGWELTGRGLAMHEALQGSVG